MEEQVRCVLFEGQVADAGDHYSSDAEVLGSAVDEIIDACWDCDVDACLMVSLMTMEQSWRGHRLAGGIIHDVMDMLRLDPDSTAVVLIPEPMTPMGPIEPGPERDAAMGRLKAGYRKEGFEPWQDLKVWWRPLPGCAE